MGYDCLVWSLLADRVWSLGVAEVEAGVEAEVGAEVEGRGFCCGRWGLVLLGVV